MTQADTVKTRRERWLVILAVTLSAIGAIFWAIENVGDNDEDRAGVDMPADNGRGSATAGATTSPVEDYIRFAAAIGDRQLQDSVPPDYVVEGLRKLAGALGTLNLGSPDLQVSLRVAAEHLLLTPASTATTAVVRDGLISAADAIEPQYGKGEVNLRLVAESIRPEKPLLDQQSAVDEFFRESATAMQQLSQRS
jgi:hypothetical protein